MLEGRNISYRYGSKEPWVLKDLSIIVQPGKVLGILGPSGCGKSTLAHLLAGYFIPKRGEVFVDGAPLPKKGYCPVQLLFQHPELAVNPNWKVARILDETCFPSSDLLKDLSISLQWMDRYPHELSGGEIQRLAVARALGPATRYLIADEMTAMLDAQTQARIWHTVRTLCRRRNIGIVAISHNRPLLERIGDTVWETPFLPSSHNVKEN